MEQIPLQTKAVVLSEYNGNLARAILGLKVEMRDMPIPGDDQVLIKTEAAPCNPSDIAFIRGGYNIKKTLPAVPGFEGSGVVINTGKNASHLKNKRVSSFVQDDRDGTWAEYFVARSRDCIVLHDALDAKQGACLSINPFTAFGLVELAEKSRSRAVVQNAAGGQVAEFVRTLCEMKGIEVINIVRKAESIHRLEAAGVKYLLNSSEDHFQEKLYELSRRLQANLAFDAVAGDSTSLLLKIMPERSKLVLYGALSGVIMNSIPAFDLIFQEKTLTGFNLNKWINDMTTGEFNAISNELQQSFINGKMQTRIQATFPIHDVVNGIRTYIKSLSEGKILFTP
jgi:NADPH:quinone reductase-like Zn-dependent oxidoreductase